MSATSTGRHRVQKAAVKYGTEPKVKAAAGSGAGVAALITPALLYTIDDLLLDGDGPVTVPYVYAALIGGAVVAVCSWAAGWLAPHVEREQVPQ